MFETNDCIQSTITKNLVIIKYLEKILLMVQEQDEKLSNFFEEKPIICFRGEAQDFNSTKLTPSYFRENENMKEINLINSLIDYEITTENKNNIQKMMDAQHYIAFSKLLDISFNVLSALYFATDYSGAQKKTDGYLYIFTFPRNFSPTSKYLNYYYESMINKKMVPYYKDFKVISHSYSNERLKLQNGGFILFPSDIYEPIPNCYYTFIRISAKHKKEIRDSLSRFFNVKESTLFPEKDKRRNVILDNMKNIKDYDYDEESLVKSGIDEFIENIDFQLKYDSSLNNDVEKERFIRKEFEDYREYLNRNFDESQNNSNLLINYLNDSELNFYNNY